MNYATKLFNYIEVMPVHEYHFITPLWYYLGFTNEAHLIKGLKYWIDNKTDSCSFDLTFSNDFKKIIKLEIPTT